MTFGVEALVAGTITDLNNDAPFRWLSDDGLGMAPVRELVERGPAQHGVTRTGYRLDPRILQVVIGILATTDSDYWTRRDQLLQLVAPADDLFSLKFTLGNGAVRQLDVAFNGDMSLGYSERQYLYHPAGIRLRAPDPTFYDPQLQAINFLFGALSTGWAIPWAIPWSIGGAVVSQTTELFYIGTWNTLPIVRIFGPITNPILTNTITRTDSTTQIDTLDFTGTTIAAGDYYEIDLRYGNKTVKDSTGTNRIDKLTDTSDLATFQIYRAREAVSGLNTFRVSGSTVNADTLLQILYYERFLGI